MNTRVVAEIGQNHSGSLEIARCLIDMAADPRPADVRDGPHYQCWGVKFTARDLEHELTHSGMRRAYTGRNAFGPTYGEHRKRLEFTDEQFAETYDYARAQGLNYVITLCHPNKLSILKHFIPDRLKVASRDLTNGPLLEALAETGIPVILSTGMATRFGIERALDIITRHHDRIVLLVCTSAYPCPPEEMHLKRIHSLLDLYPYPVGLSDHSVGIKMAVAAVSMGAEWIEKHITLDRTMRGTDQLGSMERDGMYRMLRDIHEVEQAMGSGVFHPPATVERTRGKLERSLAATRDLIPGHTLTRKDIELLSPGTGFGWHERHTVIGRVLRKPVDRHELILPEHLRENV